jgi:hypothetical protein
VHQHLLDHAYAERDQKLKLSQAAWLITSATKRRLFPFVERIIDDTGYQGPKMAATVARTGI